MNAHHLLLVLAVPIEESDFASDLLWAAGAQAIEERQDGSMVELRTDLGERPTDRWASIAASHEIPSTWRVGTAAVDKTVSDTWRRHAQPTTVANVRIVPAWQAGEIGPYDLMIDPGGAFGMGDHPTTRATLELALQCTGATLLDLGCGSGVLAIALAKFNGFRALAVDISPPAVEAARINARCNGVEDAIDTELGDVRVVRGDYDVVLANILAPVLLADAADIALRVAPLGSLVLSGFNSSREADIVKAYEALKLRAVRRLEIEGWIALQMQRVA